MTNQDFCYWLQGYFEISRQAMLTKEQILVINDALKKITEPLGDFTQWLNDLLSYFETQSYNQALLAYFLPVISGQLNLIFYHVIDHSYDTDLSHEEGKKIHDGLIHDE